MGETCSLCIPCQHSSCRWASLSHSTTLFSSKIKLFFMLLIIENQGMFVSTMTNFPNEMPTTFCFHYFRGAATEFEHIVHQHQVMSCYSDSHVFVRLSCL